MKTNFKLKGQQLLTIFPISDIHIGGKSCNYKFFEYALDKFDKVSGNNKIIYLNGDLFESAKPEYAHGQDMTLNDQMDVFMDYIEPFSSYIRGITSGNHENRLKEMYDLDVTKLVADMLDVESTPYIQDEIKINKQKYEIFGVHGRGSASADHLALGKAQRELSAFNYQYDLGFYGHVHRSGFIKDISLLPDGYKRKTTVLTGSYLNWENSYAMTAGFKPLLPSFPFVKITKDINTFVKTFNIDECGDFEKEE